MKLPLILISLFFLLISVKAQFNEKTNDDIYETCHRNQHGTYKVELRFCNGGYWRTTGQEKTRHGQQKTHHGHLKTHHGHQKTVHGYNKTDYYHKNGKSCKDILRKYPFSISGVYWISVTNQIFQVYCDMETKKGGWTLVYSYTFTNYHSFTSSSNAVIPRPNWPASSATVPVSKTPPQSKSLFGAIDWNLWKEIGNEFMVTSNINDWIVCKPGIGSLVSKKSGDITCQNIKNVSTACKNLAPTTISWGSTGPTLNRNSLFYYFDGNINVDWPTHDPCGSDQGNQKKGVSNPQGNIYIR